MMGISNMLLMVAAFATSAMSTPLTDRILSGKPFRIVNSLSGDYWARFPESTIVIPNGTILGNTPDNPLTLVADPKEMASYNGYGGNWLALKVVGNNTYLGQVGDKIVETTNNFSAIPAFGFRITEVDYNTVNITSASNPYRRIGYDIASNSVLVVWDSDTRFTTWDIEFEDEMQNVIANVYGGYAFVLYHSTIPSSWSRPKTIPYDPAGLILKNGNLGIYYATTNGVVWNYDSRWFVIMNLISFKIVRVNNTAIIEDYWDNSPIENYAFRFESSQNGTINIISIKSADSVVGYNYTSNQLVLVPKTSPNATGWIASIVPQP